MLDAVVSPPHLHAEIYEKCGLAPPRGIMMVGPSGRERPRPRSLALSRERRNNYLIAIDGAASFMEGAGRFERAHARVFKKRLARAGPCSVLRFDDAVARAIWRGAIQHRCVRRVLRKFVAQIRHRATSRE